MVEAKKKSPAKKAVKKVEKPTREPLARSARTKTVEVYTPGTATTDALKTQKAKPISPKKPATPGKKGKTSHPSYKAMVKRAIKDLRPNEKTAVSYVAIQKYIAANYPVSERFQKYVKQALKAGVADKKLVQVRASFRLSAKEERGRSRSKKSKRSASKSPSKKDRSASPKKSKSPAKAKSKSPAKAKSPKKDKKERPAKEGKKPKSPAKVSTKRGSPAKEVPTKRAKKSKPKAVPIGGESTLEETETVPRPLGLVNDFIWQFWDNGWHNYDATASDVVESTYQGYLANRGDTDVRSVHSGSWEYQVDFLAMKQTNIGHSNHTTRNIRRVPVSK